jgi:MtrB/PioB family decaheme-associated outer membrane protein
MNNDYRYSLAAAVAIALGATAAQAQQYTLDELVMPVSSITGGLGYITNDNHYFGMYHGGLVDTTELGLVPRLALDYNRRDEATGTWWQADVDSDWAGLNLEYGRQGDWDARLQYSDSVKTNPFTFNTGLTGIGSNNLTLNGTALRDVTLETERRNLRLGLKKVLPKGFDVRFKLRDEQKDGERQWGFRTATGGNIVFLAEPIDYQTREYEAIVDYTGEKLQLSGGYYGTTFDNAINRVDVGPDSVSQPLDNDSRQFFLTGGYQFTPTTRGTFHGAFGKQEQDDNFFAPAEGNGRTSLDGEVETTLLNLGLYARPTRALSLSARARYEDRNDNTPIDLYRTDTVPPITNARNNVVWSRTFTTLGLDAAYRLPMGIKLKGGYEYDKRERDIPEDDLANGAYRSVTFRDQTEEDTYTLELRRSMSDTVNGRIAYIRKNRDGSTLFPDSNLGDEDRIAPRHWADRDRDQVKLAVDWLASELLSMQFRYEVSDDDYDPSGRDLGVRGARTQLVSADASYALSYDWKLTGWVTLTESELDQSSVDTGSDEWDAKLDTSGAAAGLGLRGTPRDDLKVGVDLKYVYDRNEQDIVDRDGADTLDTLPDIHYKLWSLRLFSDYAVDPSSTVRLDVVYEQRKTNDWTWQELNGDPWLYDDGTTVIQDPNENVVFVGVSYRYVWR